MDLDELAREAQWRFRRLPPFGGTRWTTEDRLATASILFEVANSEVFHRAQEKGMTPPQVRAYLLKALLHRLLMERRHEKRNVPLQEAEGMGESPGGLDAEDADTLASRVLGKLTEEERDELAERVLPATRGPASPRTHDYRWLRVRRVLTEVAEHEELADEEKESLLEALRARLKARLRGK